jgi:hypothetical protein
VAASLPVVMAIPPPAMPGVRKVGRVVHGGCCVPVTVRARPFHDRGVGAAGGDALAVGAERDAGHLAGVTRDPSPDRLRVFDRQTCL